MDGALYYNVELEENICHIQFWFGRVHRQYTDEARISFSLKCETEEAAKAFSSWSIQVESYEALGQLMTVIRQGVVSVDDQGERDEMFVGTLLTVFEKQGFQVVVDRRLGKWTLVSEIAPGDLWVVDKEKLIKAYPDKHFAGTYPVTWSVRVLAVDEGQAKKEIAIAIVKMGEWDLLREWLDECLPVVKDETESAPEITTISMVKKILWLARG